MMANKQRGEVALHIDDKEYTVRITAGVLASAETMLGVDSMVGRQLGVRSASVLLFLTCKDQGIESIQAATDLLDKYMAPVFNALNEATDFFYQNQVGLITEDEPVKAES